MGSSMDNGTNKRFATVGDMIGMDNGKSQDVQAPNYKAPSAKDNNNDNANTPDPPSKSGGSKIGGFGRVMISVELLSICYSKTFLFGVFVFVLCRVY